jgi:hypothetical protein
MNIRRCYSALLRLIVRPPKVIMTLATEKMRLAGVIRELATEKRGALETLKQERSGLDRPDFLWHYLLQSFSTMGRAAGWNGLIGNGENYRRTTYESIQKTPPLERATHIRTVCRESGIRMPNRKATFILGCFNKLEQLGGPEAAKAQLLSQPGRMAKLRFLEALPGIGPKYARNIMMDVYHEDFHNSIAIDTRIEAISQVLGVSFSTYEEHEKFYLDVARQARVNGWELDRLLFNFRAEIEARLAQQVDTDTHRLRAGLCSIP